LGYAVLPVEDLSTKAKIFDKKYYLYPSKEVQTANSEEDGSRRKADSSTIGAIIVHWEKQSKLELVSEKEAYLKRNVITDKGLIEKEVNVERQLPRAGNLVVFIESMSETENTMGSLEKMIKKLSVNDLAGTPNYHIKYFIRASYLNSEEFTVSITEKIIKTKSSLFELFLDANSEKHLLRKQHHKSISLDRSTLQKIKTNFLTLNLILQAKSLQTGDTEEELCCSAKIALENILEIKNSEGFKANQILLNENKEVCCTVNLTLNYCRQNDSLLIRDDVESILQDKLKRKSEQLKGYRLYIRLAELIMFQPGAKKIFKFKIKFGSFTRESFIVQIPQGNNGRIMRLTLNGHEYSDSLLFEFDLSNFDEFLNQTVINNALYFSDEDFDFYKILPKLVVILVEKDMGSWEEKEIGYFEIDIPALLQDVNETFEANKNDATGRPNKDAGFNYEKSNFVKHFHNFKSCTPLLARNYSGPNQVINYRISHQIL
jgi:hypothetical protein